MRARGHALAVLTLSTVLLAGCVGLPPLEGRSVSSALENSAGTRLGKALAPQLAAHPGLSGIYPLALAPDAFAARALLARAAERTLDVQYYIWRKDKTGTLLFEALLAAAERGVRVRLLLDDNNTAGLDATLAALDTHPNIEVRLFNPFALRSPRLLGYLTDFARLNRRMHNKSFTADNQVTIVGGRNIGDEYFGAADDFLFADLDVMAVGPVVQEVSADFDRYWSSASAYPADRLLPPADPHTLPALAQAARSLEQDPAAKAYMEAVRNSVFAGELTQGRLPLDWAAARVVSDDPAKGLGLAAPDALLPQKLKRILGEPQGRVDLVSPYFVPTAAGVASFNALAARGVRVRVLTNSLEATDVAAVHAGYAKRRRALLEGGIVLYELRRLSTSVDPGGGQAQQAEAAGHAVRAGHLGSSASSLHAKTFAVDGQRVFVGSFNFDPRSANLNTEMGVVVDSPELGGQIEATFDRRVAADSYEVRLDGQGGVYWIERRGGQILRHDVEPGTTFLQRAAVWFLSLLPIEWLL